MGCPTPSTSTCGTRTGTGWRIYTSGYFTGDPGHPVLRWSVRDPRRRDFWGHAVIPSWYTEATTVLDLDGYPRPVQAVKQPAEVTVGADGFIR